jgi:hypothetical protein
MRFASSVTILKAILSFVNVVALFSFPLQHVINIQKIYICRHLEMACFFLC